MQKKTKLRTTPGVPKRTIPVGTIERTIRGLSLRVPTQPTLKFPGIKLKIILGSASKSRQQILRQLGFRFSVKTANIDEKNIRHKNARKLVLKLAHAKADALLKTIKKPSLLITSDQVVVCNKHILEKPESPQELRKYLKLYNKFPATTVTALVLTNTATNKRLDAVDSAKVYFNRFSDQEIAKIVKRKALYHCAGGFQVETKSGKPNPHIKKIVGEVASVRGLPVLMLKRLLHFSQ